MSQAIGVLRACPLSLWGKMSSCPTADASLIPISPFFYLSSSCRPINRGRMTDAVNDTNVECRIERDKRRGMFVSKTTAVRLHRRRRSCAQRSDAVLSLIDRVLSGINVAKPMTIAKAMEPMNSSPERRSSVLHSGDWIGNSGGTGETLRGRE